MPVLSGRQLSNSVKASSPPADAPMPTIANEPFSSGAGLLSGNVETAFESDSAPFFRASAALRCRSNTWGARGARTALLAGRLPALFFATHHRYLSLRQTLARVVPVRAATVLDLLEL